MKTQEQKILAHLKKYKTITSWDAIQTYGATRLAAIIFNLKAKGHIIISINQSCAITGKRWCVYRLVQGVRK